MLFHIFIGIMFFMAGKSKWEANIKKTWKAYERVYEDLYQWKLEGGRRILVFLIPVFTTEHSIVQCITFCIGNIGFGFMFFYFKK